MANRGVHRHHGRMNSRSDIFHPDFKAQPWWWEAGIRATPCRRTRRRRPTWSSSARAMAACRRRWNCAAAASRRSCWSAACSASAPRRATAACSRAAPTSPKVWAARTRRSTRSSSQEAEFLASGADSLQTLIDIIAREKIDCGLITNGRFTGAWTPQHYDDQARKVEMFNKYANVGAEMIPRERVREMMASDYYYGGMVKSGGNLHPARYYKGLLEAAHKQGAVLCGNVEAERIEKTGSGWRVADREGPDRLQGGRDRDQRLYRRPDAAPQASRRAGGEPHHRDRRAADAGDGPGPTAALDRRHQAGADLLPALARWQADDLRRPRALHARRRRK